MQRMATVKVPIKLCDRCGQPKDDVEPRSVVLPAAGTKGRRFSFDACEECRSSVPLSEWEKLLPKKPRATKASLVVSEAEVLAAAKRGARKRTVKKAAGRR